MGHSDNGASDEKDIAHHAERQRQNEATDQYEQLHRGHFRFLGKKSKAALKKLHKRAYEGQQILEQTGMPRGISGPRALADHLRSGSELAPEDQTQYEPNSKRCENRFCWIFTHVLLCVFLKRPDPILGIPPCLFCFAACLTPSLLCLPTVLSRQSACG